MGFCVFGVSGSDKMLQSLNLCDKGGGLVGVYALQLDRHNVCKLLYVMLELTVLIG